jgi:predicted small integral membrane protein
MTIRLTKVALIFAVAFYYFLVVFNNVTTYDTNYQFVKHVLMMDAIFPGNRGLWRALNSPLWHNTFYLSVIAWETATMLSCAWGGIGMAKAFRRPASEFNQAKRLAILGLTLGLLMWLVAFLSVGGEWFLMWESKTWNGQEAAVRMFTVTGICLLLIAQPDVEGQT